MENHSTEKYRGYTIEIVYDNDAQNPITEWDMLGKFCCFHRNYDLSNCNDFSDMYELHEYIVKEAKANRIVALPLNLYDHSGITISTSTEYPYNDRWDSMRVGYVFATYKDIRKEFKCKKVTKKLIDDTLRILQGEVETFDQYLTGEVYGYQVLDKHGDIIDSCYGYYGEPDYCLNEAKGTVDYRLKADEELLLTLNERKPL